MVQYNKVRTKAMRERMAKDLIKLGGVVECMDCGAREPITERIIVASISGWWHCPVCGHDTRWLTDDELGGA